MSLKTTHSEDEVINLRLKQLLGMSEEKAGALIEMLNDWMEGRLEREVGRMAHAALRRKREREEGAGQGA